jgi:hypothetical protein
MRKTKPAAATSRADDDAKPEDDQLDPAGRQMLDRLEAFHATGRRSLEEGPTARYRKVADEAKERGLHPEMLRKARRFADTYSDRNLRSLVARCRQGGHVLGLSHVIRLMEPGRGGRVLLASDRLGLLAAPLGPPQHVPDARRVEPDAERLADQHRDPVQRPQVVGIPVGDGPAGEQRQEDRHLVAVQPRGRPGVRLGRQGRRPVPVVPLSSGGDRHGGRPDHPGDLPDAETLPQEFHCPASPPLQLLRSPLRSHAVLYTPHFRSFIRSIFNRRAKALNHVLLPDPLVPLSVVNGRTSSREP